MEGLEAVPASGALIKQEIEQNFKPLTDAIEKGINSISEVINKVVDAVATEDFVAKDGEMIVIDGKSKDIATETPTVKSEKVSGVIDGSELLNGASGKNPSRIYDQAKNFKKIVDNVESLKSDKRTTGTFVNEDGNTVILRDNYKDFDMDGLGSDGYVVVTKDSIVQRQNSLTGRKTTVIKKDTTYTNY